MNDVLITGWQLTDTDAGDAPGPDAAWLDAVVPGGVHESLIAAGVIGHPFADSNVETVRWVEERTWWYRATLPPVADVGAGERLLLRFDALDGVATVWLDGQEVARHVNQHRPAVLDVTARASAGADVLVRFTPPLAGLVAPGEAEAAREAFRHRVESLGIGRPIPDVETSALQLARSRLRKATFSWGWDFGARLPSIGLQSAVRLVRQRGACIAGVHARTVALDLAARTATVEVDVEIDAFARPDTVRLTLTSPAGIAHVAEAAANGPVVSFSLDLDRVDAWWTHDLGAQPLYVLKVELLPTAEGGAAVLDVHTERIGLRTIELDQGPDQHEGGRRFRFLLNGVPTFARGANWVPASLMVGSVTDQTLRDLVMLARRGEMNMLRIWGGGIYEQDAFYETCDELGVLVWQDFMFACFDYPSDDPALTVEVELEAIHQVRRLRNHACLALWSGNNEVQAIHQLSGASLDPGNWGYSFFHDLLPRVVAAQAPGALYWPGSPWGETPGELVNGVSDGDRHAWEVWHGGTNLGANGPKEFTSRGEAMHFARYGHDTGRFISEFGIHASPELGTLERWTSPGSLSLGSPAFLQRNCDEPKDKGDALMEYETGRPTTLQQYVDFSMACQAEGLKFGVEHYRRRQPTCSGTLVWQFNDVWPGFSWSVIDHDLVAKAGYYFMQRAYRPVIATFATTAEGELELWVTSAANRDAELHLYVEVVTFDGVRAASEYLAVEAPALSSRVAWRSRVPGPDHVAWVRERDGGITPNRRFFVPVKELPLTGRVEATVMPTGPTTADVELRSTGYSYMARVLAPAPGVLFDSNYVDLRDGDRHVIRVSNLPEGLDPMSLRATTYGESLASTSDARVP